MNEKRLFHFGAVAPVVVLLFYLIQLVTISLGPEFPTQPAEWFDLLHQSRLLGLIYLNALDIFSFALLGITFLALSQALRSFRPALASVALYLAFLGVVTFIVPRVALLSVVRLSDQYALAESEAVRSTLLSAGTALSALGVATPRTLGFFFLALSGVLMSALMLKGDQFSLLLGNLGFAAGGVTLADGLSWLIAPQFAGAFMPLSGLLWLLWWLLAGWELFKSSRVSSREEA
jgi:hypothetical protein